MRNAPRNTPLERGSDCTAMVRYTGRRIRPPLPLGIVMPFYSDPFAVFFTALGIIFCAAA